MKPAKDMTDDELGEAILELAAPRARMAPLEDLRKIADTLATLAVEAAARIRGIREQNPLAEFPEERGPAGHLAAAVALEAIEAVLLEALPRVHPIQRSAAAIGVIRKIGSAVDVLGLDPPAARSAIMRASAMVPFCKCGRPMWHHVDPNHVGDCLEYLPAARPPVLEQGPGPMLGKVRDVVLHGDGRLTCSLEVNDAGAEFIRQINGGSRS